MIGEAVFFYPSEENPTLKVVQYHPEMYRFILIDSNGNETFTHAHRDQVHDLSNEKIFPIDSDKFTEALAKFREWGILNQPDHFR